MKKEDVFMDNVDLVVGFKTGGSVTMASYPISYLEAKKVIEAYIQSKEAKPKGGRGSEGKV